MYLWYTQEGDTAIMAAAGRGHSDIVRMLLASPGINLRATDYVRILCSYIVNYLLLFLKLSTFTLPGWEDSA